MYVLRRQCSGQNKQPVPRPWTPPTRCLRNERGLEPGESRKARTLGGNEEPWRPCEELFQGRWQDTDA